MEWWAIGIMAKAPFSYIQFRPGDARLRIVFRDPSDKLVALRFRWHSKSYRGSTRPTDAASLAIHTALGELTPYAVRRPATLGAAIDATDPASVSEIVFLETLQCGRPQIAFLDPAMAARPAFAAAGLEALENGIQNDRLNAWDDPILEARTIMGGAGAAAAAAAAGAGADDGGGDDGPPPASPALDLGIGGQSRLDTRAATRETDDELLQALDDFEAGRDAADIAAADDAAASAAGVAAAADAAAAAAEADAAAERAADNAAAAAAAADAADAIAQADRSARVRAIARTAARDAVAAQDAADAEADAAAQAASDEAAAAIAQADDDEAFRNEAGLTDADLAEILGN